MYKVFIDTNVVLDYYLNREGFSNEAEEIFACGFNHKFLLFASSLTFSNFAYIASKKFSGVMMYEVLESLSELVDITYVDVWEYCKTGIVFEG